MSALWWGLTALKFSFTWVRHKSPPGPPKYEKSIFCSYFGFRSYQIASLFDMHIVMGERIAGKQDRPSLIIENPLRAPQITQNMHIFLHFGSYMKNWFSNCFPLLLCLHCVEVCICWHFGACYPWILCKGPTWPRKKWNLFYFFHIFYFNSKGSYHIASIFDM